MSGSVLVNVCIALILYFIRWPVASAYISHSDGDSSEVWELTGNTLPFLCIHLVFDLTQGVQGGIIRGVGLQSRAFWIALVCYYFIGVPIGASLMFKTDLALKGTWIGIAICSLFVNISFGTLLICSKWNKI